MKRVFKEKGKKVVPSSKKLVFNKIPFTKKIHTYIIPP